MRTGTKIVNPCITKGSKIMQKRLPGVVLLKKIFLKTGKFQRKAPVLESHFNKVAGLRPSTL